jgi:hypothetical protein
VSSVTNEALRVKMTDEHLQRVLIQGFKPAIRLQVMSAGNCDTIQQMLLMARNCEAAQSGDHPSTSTTNENLSAMITQLMAKVSAVAEANKRLLTAASQPPIMAPVSYIQDYGQHQQPIYQQQQAPPSLQQHYYAQQNQQSDAPPVQRSYPNSNYHDNNFKRNFGQTSQASRTMGQRTNDQQWTNQSHTNGDPSQTQGTASNQTENILCAYCGQQHSRGPRSCSAYGTVCGYCGLQNHTEAQCFQRQNGQRNAQR